MILGIARQVQVDVHALSFIGGTIVPLLVAFVTKERSHRAIKAGSLAVLSALSGVIALALKANGSIDFWTAIDSLGASFIAAVASYYGFWKPTGIAPAIAVGSRTFGIGVNVGPEADKTLVEPTSTASKKAVNDSPLGDHFRK